MSNLGTEEILRNRFHVKVRGKTGLRNYAGNPLSKEANRFSGKVLLKVLTPSV